MFECYENIIGVSETECLCYPDKPIDSTSNSGLYLDDLEGLETVTELGDCTTGNVWEIGQKAINEAIKCFVADSNALLLNRFKTVLKKYSGLLGWANGRKPLSLTKDYAGIVVSCRPVKGGYIKLQDVGLMFDESTQLDVRIFDHHNNLLHTIDCDAVGGKKHSNPVDNIILPMFTAEYGRMTYFFVYERMVQPLDNLIGCTCGGGFSGKYSLDNPYYYGNWSASHSWANWVMSGGIQKDDLVSFNDESFGPVSNYAHGISLHLEFYCKASEALCKDVLDFEDPLNLCKALAIRYKAAQLIAGKLANSSLLTRAAFLSKDDLKERSIYWESMYQEKLRYIIQNADPSDNGCLGCNPAIQIGMGKILT